MPTLLTAPAPAALRERHRSEQELAHASIDHRSRSLADLALTRRVQETLRQSPYRRLHMVSAEVHSGVAVLAGRVPSFHIKQAACCLLSDLEGLSRIDNRLEVTC